MGLPSLGDLVALDEHHQCKEMPELCVRVVAVAELPSRFGSFQVVGFVHNDPDRKEHAAFVHGDVIGQDNVLVRIHSECLTGDAIGSLRCDCRDQLEFALRHISGIDRGVVLYMRQEGRGIGLTNKIRAYQLQDQGMDTYEANEALGFKPDERHYGVAAHMIKSLRIGSVRVLTNNPDKIHQLEHFGVTVTGRVPIQIPANKYNRHYLETKRIKGHWLERNEPIEQREQTSERP